MSFQRRLHGRSSRDYGTDDDVHPASPNIPYCPITNGLIVYRVMQHSHHQQFNAAVCKWLGFEVRNSTPIRNGGCLSSFMGGVCKLLYSLPNYPPVDGFYVSFHFLQNVSCRSIVYRIPKSWVAFQELKLSYHTPKAHLYLLDIPSLVSSN